MSKQPSLFSAPKPEHPWKIPALRGYAYIIEPFDFERDGIIPKRCLIRITSRLNGWLCGLNNIRI